MVVTCPSICPEVLVAITIDLIALDVLQHKLSLPRRQHTRIDQFGPICESNV
jgi:hypothetical protein